MKVSNNLEGNRRLKRDAELVTQWGTDPIDQVWGTTDAKCGDGIPTDPDCKYAVVDGSAYSNLDDLVEACDPSTGIMTEEESTYWNATDKPIHELPDSEYHTVLAL